MQLAHLHVPSRIGQLLSTYLRRNGLDLAVLVVLTLVAALPLSLLWDEARQRSIRLTALAMLIVALAVGSVAAIDLSRYFTSYPDHPTARWAYGVEMAEASRYVTRFPKDTFVYSYSSRWSFDYDVRRFLAPDARGKDRSTKFSDHADSLSADRSRGPGRSIAPGRGL